MMSKLGMLPNGTAWHKKKFQQFPVVLQLKIVYSIDRLGLGSIVTFNVWLMIHYSSTKIIFPTTFDSKEFEIDIHVIYKHNKICK